MVYKGHAGKVKNMCPVLMMRKQLFSTRLDLGNLSQMGCARRIMIQSMQCITIANYALQYLFSLRAPAAPIHPPPPPPPTTTHTYSGSSSESSYKLSVVLCTINMENKDTAYRNSHG